MRLFSKTESVEETTTGRFGHPGPCPRCGGRGWLTSLDLHDRCSDHRCLACGHVWSAAERRRPQRKGPSPRVR